MFSRFTPGFVKTCHHPGCCQPLMPKHHLIGPTVVINWTCTHGHKGKFSSSKDINDMYANNLQVAASILLSGNNFTKIERMCSFLGPSFISDSTFYRMQQLYLVPCINEWWNWQRDQLIEEFKSVEVVVCGDGQCDSPRTHCQKPELFSNGACKRLHTGCRSSG